MPKSPDGKKAGEGPESSQYDLGFAHGFESAKTDWLVGLYDLPFEVNSPEDVIAGVDALMKEIEALRQGVWARPS